MKIKRIAQLCRQNGLIVLYEGQDRVQWISDGAAAYPLYGLPRFEPENICTFFDITAKQSEKITIKHEQLPECLCFKDTNSDEIPVKCFELDLSCAGRTLIPYRTSSGVHFIDSRYLAPLTDLQENLEIHERISKDGNTYFAAKSGLMLYGVILPCDLISDNMVQSLKALYHECKIALFNKTSRESGMYSFVQELEKEEGWQPEQVDFADNYTDEDDEDIGGRECEPS